MKKFKSSQLSRLTKLGKSLVVATGHLAIDAVKNKTQDLIDKSDRAQELTRKISATKEIVQSMGELKGALMKLGQMISITEDMVLPPEISALFRELQKTSPPMSHKDLHSVFYKSFNKRPLELYAEFDETPIAAASIGQVHLAKTFSGEQVAVKVQYPQIVDAIKNDFKNIDRINQLINLLFPNKPDIEHYVEELRRSLIEECNYLKEREHLERYREIYSSEFPQILVPKVFPELCSENILTLEYMTGDTFGESLSYSQTERDELGQILFDSHMFGIYNARFLHTDPQNGNYLFRPGKIILMDFGSVKEFDLDFIKKYHHLLSAIEKDQLEEYRRAMLDLGFFEESDEIDLFHKHFEMVKKLYLPYTRQGIYSIEKINPFEMVQDFMKGVSLKGRKAPREDFLLLDRANLGIYSKLKTWNSHIDWLTRKNKYTSNL